jgi:hypothetical protein
VLSRRDVVERLRDGFIGLRLDWEQGNHLKERFGFILGTGDQMLLDPEGKPIAHGDGDGARSLIYGRNGLDTTATVLDGVTARFRPKDGPPALELGWFLWPSIPCRDGKGVYPVPVEAIAGFARLPIASVEGPIPAALEDPAFLRRHVREFIWVRGKGDGPGRIAVRRARDGLKPGLSTELASIDAAASCEAIGAALDRAWLEYMKDRPFIARGYLENPHGKWMRGMSDQMLGEEETIRRLAREGKLLPPGVEASTRAPGERGSP